MGSREYPTAVRMSCILPFPSMREVVHQFATHHSTYRSATVTTSTTTFRSDSLLKLNRNPVFCFSMVRVRMVSATKVTAAATLPLPSLLRPQNPSKGCVIT